MQTTMRGSSWVGHVFSNHHILKCSGPPPVLFDQFLTFFSHKSEPTSVLFSYKRASNYITDNQYFSLIIFWQIRYVH